jgi:hypothetical protein
MLASGKLEIARPSFQVPNDITIGDLLEALAAHGSKPLVFEYDGCSVKPGYHVTEVKAGQFSALDCGANPEQWTEIFIQLWDVHEGKRTHMPAGKFAAIIRKVTEHVPLDPTARLTFEVSDGVRPMQLYRASIPDERDGAVLVTLFPRPASCKPRDRWLEKQDQSAASGCCGSSREQPCCT